MPALPSLPVRVAETRSCLASKTSGTGAFGNRLGGAHRGWTPAWARRGCFRPRTPGHVDGASPSTWVGCHTETVPSSAAGRRRRRQVATGWQNHGGEAAVAQGAMTRPAGGVGPGAVDEQSSGFSGTRQSLTVRGSATVAIADISDPSESHGSCPPMRPTGHSCPQAKTAASARSTTSGPRRCLTRRYRGSGSRRRVVPKRRSSVSSARHLVFPRRQR